MSYYLEDQISKILFEILHLNSKLLKPTFSAITSIYFSEVIEKIILILKISSEIIKKKSLLNFKSDIFLT